MTGLVFLQLAIILGASWLASYVVRRLWEPPVIGQMLAGVIVGPSVFGVIAPHWQHLVFPVRSLDVIHWLGQIGVAVYMFTVGAELNLTSIRRQWQTAASVSIVGTLIPLLAGATLGAMLFQQSGFFGPSITHTTAAGFLAVVMAVTAFPVMARILSEHRLMHTSLASLALACGCFSDATAWCLLAFLLAGLAGTYYGAALTLLGTVALVLGLVLVVRPLMHRIAIARADGSRGRATLKPTVVIMLMLVAWLSDLIGVHPAFGGFLLGAVMPRQAPDDWLPPRFASASAELLLPLFFAYAGLNAQLGLVSGPRLILIALVITLVAMVSKGSSSGIVARLTGASRRDAAALGVLLNARGLVELIVITIGLEKHVITPTLFTILLLMTVVTTLIPSPVLSALYPRPLLRVTGERALPGSNP
jgi:Kef-type K+ transport system membrane component KefB